MCMVFRIDVADLARPQAPSPISPRSKPHSLTATSVDCPRYIAGVRAIPAKKATAAPVEDGFRSAPPNGRKLGTRSRALFHITVSRSPSLAAGAQETSPSLASLSTARPRRPGRCGKPSHGVQIRLNRPKNRPLWSGRDGISRGEWHLRNGGDFETGSVDARGIGADGGGTRRLHGHHLLHRG